MRRQFPGAARTDCQLDESFRPTWSGSHTFNGNVTLAGGFKINGTAAEGKIPIGDGTNAVPGDRVVQGTQADGSKECSIERDRIQQQTKDQQEIISRQRVELDAAKKSAKAEAFGSERNASRSGERSSERPVA
jgi:hypothetical protein